MRKVQNLARLELKKEIDKLNEKRLSDIEK